MCPKLVIAFFTLLSVIKRVLIFQIKETVDPRRWLSILQGFPSKCEDRSLTSSSVCMCKSDPDIYCLEPPEKKNSKIGSVDSGF